METHKHKGLLTTSGSLRMHPVERVHKDPKVQKWHYESLGVSTNPKLMKELMKNSVDADKTTDTVVAKVDDDNYINIDLDKCVKQRGIRIKFTRQKKGKERQVGLAIDREE